MREYAALHSSLAVLRQIFRQQDRFIYEGDFGDDSFREADRRALPQLHSTLPRKLLLHVEFLDGTGFYSSVSVGGGTSSNKVTKCFTLRDWARRHLFIYSRWGTIDTRVWLLYDEIG